TANAVQPSRRGCQFIQLPDPSHQSLVSQPGRRQTSHNAIPPTRVASRTIPDPTSAVTDANPGAPMGRESKRPGQMILGTAAAPGVVSGATFDRDEQPLRPGSFRRLPGAGDVADRLR